MPSSRRRPKRGIWWVSMGPEPYMATCQRCGKHEPKPELPVGLSAFETYIEYVSKRHAHCPAPEEEPAT